jgi:phage FluMu protein Com
MQIRCYRCGWSFAIKKEEAAFALQALEETGGSHYDSNCPRCRHSNRISLEQLTKASPRSADEAGSAEPQDTAEVAKEVHEQEMEVAEPETEDQEVKAISEESKPKRRRRRA